MQSSKKCKRSIRESCFVITPILKREGAISTYQVTEFDVINENYIKDVTFCVYFNDDEIEVQCSAVVHYLN
jgi:hypothetical protein